MSTGPVALKVGAVLFADFELLDVFGPLEMFGLLDPGADITLLAESPGSIRSNQGPSCVAERALSAAGASTSSLCPEAGARGARC